MAPSGFNEWVAAPVIVIGLLAVIVIAPLPIWRFLVRTRVLEAYYRKRQAKEPRNPKWPARLGFLYWCRMAGKPTAERVRLASLAAAEYEKWLALHGPINHDYSALHTLARAALEAGDLHNARRHATTLLRLAKRHPTWGNAHHHGHTVLGRLALRSGDVPLAREHLLSAGRMGGSPQLNSFGPAMTLAHELLEAGERECVLEYLALCTNFWEGGHRYLSRWAAEIDAGTTPRFWVRAFGKSAKLRKL